MQEAILAQRVGTTLLRAFLLPIITLTTGTT